MAKRFHQSTLPTRKFTRKPGPSSGLGTAPCAAIGCRHRIWPQKQFCNEHMALVSREDAAALTSAYKASTRIYWEGGRQTHSVNAKLHYQRLLAVIVCRVSDAEWQMKEVQA